LEFIASGTKIYEVVIRLGASSDSYDVMGKIITQECVPPKHAKIIQIIKEKFIGKISQVPPIFSAIKINGKKAYEIARKNTEVDKTFSLPARLITIYSIDILNYTFPLLTLRVKCGSGTYIRSLAHDLGNVLDCGGIIEKLRRVYCEPFNETDTVRPEQISSEKILVPEKYLTNLSHIQLTSEEKEKISHGCAIDLPEKLNNISEEVVALYENKIYAMLRSDKKCNVLRPHKVL